MDNEALIDGYFENNLSEGDREEFERLLKTDAEFKADFEFQQELQRSLKKEERQQIKSLFSRLASEMKVDSRTNSSSRIHTLSNTEKEEARKPDTKVFSMRPWLVAASVALFFGLGSWLLFFNNPDFDTEELYAAHFAPYENVVHPLERGEQMEDLKTKAFIAYEDADYPSALELFKELQAQQSDPYIEFYVAIVLMQLDRHGEAIPLLDAYILKGGQLKDRATWYLALAYLKLGEVEKTRKELEKLANNEGFKANAAKELLEKTNG